MKKQLTQVAVFLLLSALFLTAVYLFRPINEVSLVRQTQGTDFSQPYLGRTWLVENGKNLRQDFISPAEGLISAVGIPLPAPNRTAQGQAYFKLIKRKGHQDQLVFSSKSDISKLSNNEGLSIWRFAPIKVNRGDRLSIQLKVEADPGLLVFVSSHDAYEKAPAFTGGRPLGADIAFQVFYRFGWARYWRRLASDSPNLIGPFPLSIALIAFWLALAVWFKQIWRLGRSWNQIEAGRSDRR